MAATVFGFDWPDRLVVGTVGEPGSRAFYLQVRDAGRIVSIGLEKQQAAVLAEKIDEILDGLLAGDNPFSVPAVAPRGLADHGPLEQPVEAEFRAGAMSLAWDPTTAQLVIEAYPLAEADDEQDPAGPSALLRVRIPVGAARAFAKRTLEIVRAGRPLCPLCGAPIDAGGHVCVVPGDPF
jgi:uncharacterized repeat protein (TIGR03847 family)